MSEMDYTDVELQSIERRLDSHSGEYEVCGEAAEVMAQLRARVAELKTRIDADSDEIHNYVARVAELEAELERERQYANNAVTDTVSEVRQLETENARMRTALQKISDDSPATCEMSPAHSMGQTANEALQEIASEAQGMGLENKRVP